MWRERAIPRSKEIRTFKHFAEFVVSPLPDGLGSDLDTIKRMIGASTEPEATKAADLIDQTLQRPDGRPVETVDNIHSLRPAGTSSDAALRRLRKDAPELHAEVIAGQKSPHAAMVEAGFRPKTITLPLDVEKAAAAIKRHFSAEQIDVIVAAICKEKQKSLS